MSSGPAAAGANNSNIPRRKEISSRDVFVLMGHGNEVPIEFNDRRKVPDGKIIVLLAEYGKPVKSYHGEEIWESMAKNPEVFLRPESEEAKKMLTGAFGDTIHVYYPGDRIPKFLYYPFLVQNQGGRWSAYPSGIFKLDMAKETGYALPTNGSGKMKKLNVSRGSVPWDTIFSGEENKEFLKNIREKNSSFIAPSMYHRKEEIEKVFVKDSDKLLDELPDGIHYFMSCRLIKGQAAQVAAFFDKLLKDIDFVIYYLWLFEEGTDYLDKKMTKSKYEKELIDYERKMYDEVYTGPLRPILIRTYPVLKEGNLPENEGEDYMYFYDTRVIPLLKNVKRCIEATRLQNVTGGQFTADEFLQQFNLELSGFKKANNWNTNAQFFYKLIDDIIKTGLKHILEPSERIRRKSILQQQKAGRKTRKLKKKK
jgi:hypothetical protein